MHRPVRSRRRLRHVRCRRESRGRRPQDVSDPARRTGGRVPGKKAPSWPRSRILQPPSPRRKSPPTLKAGRPQSHPKVGRFRPHRPATKSSLRRAALRPWRWARSRCSWPAPSLSAGCSDVLRRRAKNEPLQSHRLRIPCFIAATTALVRSLAPSLSKALLRWLLTVASLIQSSEAISLLLRHLATSPSISVSRRLRTCSASPRRRPIIRPATAGDSGELPSIVSRTARMIYSGGTSLRRYSIAPASMASKMSE